MALPSRAPLHDPYPACPKCGGQYHRDGTVCQCYLCCFEWDLKDRRERVLARARYQHRPDSDPLELWKGLLQEKGPESDDDLDAEAQPWR